MSIASSASATGLAAAPSATSPAAAAAGRTSASSAPPPLAIAATLPSNFHQLSHQSVQLGQNEGHFHPQQSLGLHEISS
ncbi:unnamed protein product [Linum trigynum]|uniref:Uncharacterized protein n=1 Tax=Linum trigynum TaxID=586398 RepID=A0AAV2EF06_9ROSI